MDYKDLLKAKENFICKKQVLTVAKKNYSDYGFMARKHCGKHLN